MKKHTQGPWTYESDGMNGWIMDSRAVKYLAEIVTEEGENHARPLDRRR